MIASGGGVKVLTMVDFEGNPSVPLLALFAFDPTFLMFNIPGNHEAFLLPTYSRGDLRIEHNAFSLSLFGSIPKVTFSMSEDGRPLAEVEGTGACGVSLTENKTSIAGLELKESIRSVGKALPGVNATQPDSFSLEILIRDSGAPKLFSIFGPQQTFAGKMVGRKATVKEISRLPI